MIMKPTTERLVDDYLKQLDSELADLPRLRRKEIVEEISEHIAETRGTGFGVRSSPAEIESETLEALRSAVATLESKAPDEVEAYKSFVLDVAQSVGEAAEGGSEAEGAVVEKIRSVLAAQ